MLAKIKKQEECKMTREEIVRLGNEAIAKAKKDPEFKKKLLSDGNKAVKELTGKELPIKLTVHDTDEKHLVFILPEVLSGELGESVLSGVSGGKKIDIDMYKYDNPTLAKYGMFRDDKVKFYM